MRIGAFRRVFASNVVNGFGSSIAPVALAFAVVGGGSGGSSLAVVLALNIVPTVVFLLYGGALADRVSRSRLLFAGRLSAALVQAAVAAVVAVDARATLLLGGLSFLSGAAAAISRPAQQGILRQIVPEHLIQQANALARFPQNAVRVAGPAVGGLVISVSSPAVGLAVDAASFVLSALLVLGLDLGSVTTARGTLRQDFAEGWSQFLSRTWMWTYTLSGTAVLSAWMAGNALLGPVVAADRYHGAAGWGALQAGFAAGMVAGSGLALAWKPRRLLTVALCVSCGLALPLAAMGAHAPFAIVMTAMLLAGLAMDIASVAWNVVLASHVEDRLQGRLFAINAFGETAAIPLGYILVAVALPVVSPGPLLLAAAALIVLACLANLLVPQVHSIVRDPQHA
ncbi:MFS transporter (plasmid) [Amycolatopsis sp. AA4]|nr:MFS transporter [Amycolatopsis sp. AA4]